MVSGDSVYAVAYGSTAIKDAKIAAAIAIQTMRGKWRTGTRFGFCGRAQNISTRLTHALILHVLI
jgi:hypothetical protein